MRMPTLAIFMLLLAVPAHSAIPSAINYQGYLTDDTGQVIDGLTEITYSIYAVATGGAPLWSGTIQTPVDQGLFSVNLGGVGNPFPAGMFSTPLWIGLTVTGDAEMTPRLAMTSVGFAFEADNALQLQGQGAAAYDQSGEVANLQSQLDDALATIATLQSGLTAAQASINTLSAQVGLVETDVTNIQADVAGNDTDIATLQSDLFNLSVDVVVNDNEITVLQTDLLALEASEVFELEPHLDVFGTRVTLSGVNLRIVNGTGTTGGPVNGAGNLIIGYNTPGTGSAICSNGVVDNQVDCENGGHTWAVSHKTGSHNIIVGDEHNFSQHSSIVTGLSNDINGVYSAAIASTANSALGSRSAVIGGESNLASGFKASVVGGENNSATSVAASVFGGGGPNANEGNEAHGRYSVVVGGTFNTAGDPNLDVGRFATILGGSGNEATGQRSTIAGGSSGLASGQLSSVTGGSNNSATGTTSTVSGGANRSATGPSDWVAGSLFEDF